MTTRNGISRYKIIRSSSFLALAVLGLSVALANSASAAEALYEGFAYTDSGGFADVVSQSGGTGWGGAWTQTKFPMADVRTTVPGQTYGALPVSGLSAVSATTLWGHGSRSIGTALSGPGLLTDGASLWFSMLIDNSAANGAGVKNGVVLSNGAWSTSNQEELAAGVQGIGVLQSNFGTIRAGHWLPGQNTVDTGLNAFPGTTLVVGEIIWGTGGGNETLNIYNPDTLLNQGAVIATQSIPDLSQATFNTVALLTKDDGHIDEIRFGATYNSVVGISAPSGAVPEPSTFTLGFLGLLGLGMTRRRRRRR